ncbi:ArsR/SmtB family transcription factor [Dactylosporangium sp. CA-092794]|uniref:ArsR/SmtB family transcription factor n=1 Tax=Dactylosporangium sp. CA-092794 TaxID=3239929 RepID=UPI003D8C4BF3
MARTKTTLDLAAATSPECCTPLVGRPLTAPEAADTAKLFKALSDPVRLRLLSLIAARGDGEVCVCELTGEFEVTAPTISFHLRVLRESGLVSSERRATWVYYRVNRAMLDRLGGFFAAPALAAV